MLKIITANSGENIEQVRMLWREYGIFLKGCFPERKELPAVIRYFENYEQEISNNLPGRFGLPMGCLLLARYQTKPAGCVGLMDLGDSICELRRLFVKPEYRRLGVGKALIEAAIEHAKRIGYNRLWLNTNKRMATAEKLYRSYGFRDIEPYEQFDVDGMVFLELTLT
jgi:putative acetyltransferase